MLKLLPCLCALAGLVTIATTQSEEAAPSFGVTVHLLFNEFGVPEYSPRGTYVALVMITGASEDNVFACDVSDDKFGLLGPLGDPTERMLYLKSELDREQQPTHHFNVCCVEYTTAHRECATVRLDVEDINDNAPIFPVPSMEFSLAENTTVGSSIGQVTASDNDLGVNGRITYEMDGPNNDQFSVDRDTGVIQLTRPLDYELQRSHTFNVVARDHGAPSHSTTLRVTVHVLDINDNAPMFHQPQYEMSVTCGAPVGYQIGTIGVMDIESGYNGQVTLSVQHDTEASNIFSLDSTTLVTSVPVTSDLVGQYSFHLVASDHGSPPLSSTVPVTVTVACDTL